MTLHYKLLNRDPRVFQSLSGLPLLEFEQLVEDVLPLYQTIYVRHLEKQRRQRHQPPRLRAVGGGPAFALETCDQIFLVVVWLHQHPTHEVLANLLGISAPSVSRLIGRLLPLIQQSGHDTMRLPDPGKKHRRTWEALLHETPQLAVLVDSFEQRVPWPHSHRRKAFPKSKHQPALTSHEGKMSGQIVDVSASSSGPAAGI